MNKNYIPQGERKKILLLCDDIRTHSGVGTVGRELVRGTCHHYNWVNLGAAINHPEQGKRLDISEDTNTISGCKDSSVIIYPSNGYGNADLLRQVINMEKPDAIFLITDPRYFVWLFQIENEIRKKIPIVYLNIWDDLPAPMYNKEFYESCDALLGISKQTVNINKLVLGKKAQGKVIEYVPHGLNQKIFSPITEEYEKFNEFLSFKDKLFRGKSYDFVTFFNSRNIRRKQIPDTIWAYKQFIDKLTPEQAEKCAMVLHTQKVDNNGTDLPAVIEALCGDDPKYTFIFSENKLSPEHMGWLYNCTDVQIQLTNNEGWGLSLTEAILCGNPIIANVTGGMQDQMRFEDERGLWIDFDDMFPSNHTGRYTKCGPWAFPVFPTNRSIAGSPTTPYIWDDRCDAGDAAEQLHNVWSLTPEERQKRGNLGREWALGEAGFTTERQGERVISYVDTLLNTWTPRKNYELIKVGPKKAKQVPHNLVY